MVIGLDAATPELTTAAITLADQLRFPVMVVPYSPASRPSVGLWRTRCR